MNSVLFLLYLSVLLKIESKRVCKKVLKGKVTHRGGPFFVRTKSFCVIRVKRNKMALHTVGDEANPSELSILKEEPPTIGTNEASEVGNFPNEGTPPNRPKLTNILLIVDYDGTNYSGWTGIENCSDIYLRATRNYKNGTTEKRKAPTGDSKCDTVQNTILNCLLQIHGYGYEMKKQEGEVKSNLKAFEFIGVSRTDKGVHAKEYVCQYVSYERPPPCDGNLHKVKMALNGLLNKDIRILGVLNAPFPDFNVRFNNLGKIYTYNFDVRVPSQPLERNYAWQLYDDPRFAFLLRGKTIREEVISDDLHCGGEAAEPPTQLSTELPTQPDVSHCLHIINRQGGSNPTIPFDMEKIKECCKLFIGHHNFEFFRGTLKGTEKQKKVDPFCNIYFLELHELRSNIYQFVIQGDRFLYHMIRIIVGTLLQVGVGLLEYEDVRDALHFSKPLKVKLCAPAQGLCLTKILFPPNIQGDISAALLS
ncbi:tRNA pseudouridine synthase [Plasmodium coatneyi]|uniref:tRNA pseudouridine synthase n=1 Tax=Plasmodium coatneyi TaxID=208452 RepID=A0A1B1E135_9APIC|nr:tRNA pseudouridine synthase [Plasmodium coatneyi]ANQ08756.1 tRNA pseudouridine synthase [Plasmodium coatneyi]